MYWLMPVFNHGKFCKACLKPRFARQTGVSSTTTGNIMHTTILLAPIAIVHKAYMLGATHAPFQVAYNRGEYERTKPYTFGHDDTEPESAAEEMFDLTNNPSRQEERELVYGRGRSLSVGDIVEVEQGEKLTAWLCMCTGWKQIK
jgi:hypothetical protein